MLTIQYIKNNDKYRHIKEYKCSCGFVGVVDHYNITKSPQKFKIKVRTNSDVIYCPKCNNYKTI